MSVGVSSNALLIFSSFLDTGAGPNLISKDFLLQTWKDSLKSIKSPQPRMANRKVVKIEGNMLLFIPMSELPVRNWFGIVENPAVEVLFKTSIIDQCIRRIFPTECKIVPRHLKPVAIISTKTAIDFIDDKYTSFNVNSQSKDEAPSEELN